MSTEINFEQMSVTEKLSMMERLWDALCRVGTEIPSPEWHGNVLSERESLARDGSDEFVDWDQAKKEMRKQIS